MNTVQVKASRSYEVHIGAGLLQTLGEKTAALVKGRTAAIVSDDTVCALYGAQARRSLEQAGFHVVIYEFPHGEQSKNGETYLNLLNFLAENRLTRADVLIALGGGVTGDLTGFAAATYLRGVACVQVPTSLLAMVDSSVGGKTAIDLPAGKNLCGAFYQPRLVLCDTDTLQTLPPEIFRDGCAEVIKYGVLGSEALFAALSQGPQAQNWQQVITDCVTMKRDIVEDDEFDTGRRQLLNLGHTLGHAVEAGSEFRLSHGKCVAIGMVMIAKAAVRHGFCSEAVKNRVEALLRQYGLPTETDQPAEAMVQTALGDKKRQGGTLTLVVPAEIGRCILHRIPVTDLPLWV